MRHRSPGRRCAVWLPALMVLFSALPSFALPREVWVVNEESRDISIIDDLADVPATIETIALGGPADPRPYGIAFSTLVAGPGDHVFVSQGARLLVIDFLTRSIVDSIDVAALIGRPDALLRGMDAARPERFPSEPGLRYFLHVAADVRPAPGEPLEPWFVVLDQAALVGAAPGGTPLVVADGPLAVDPPAGLQAMEVHVLGSPHGEDVQRAWYTWREPSNPPRLFAGQVASGPDPAPPWGVRRRVAQVLPVGSTLPDSIHPGAPHTRELPILPEGPTGDLVNLDTGARCGMGHSPRAVAVAGPGLASYDLWILKLDPLGPSDLLQRSNWETCDADPPIPVGRNPVDLATLGRVKWKEVYVASRDSDSVTVVQAGAPQTPIEILLDPAPGPCSKCPRSIAVREGPETICRATDLRLERIGGGDQILHTWGGIGCAGIDSYRRWCRCLTPFLEDCPTDCVQNCPAPDPTDQTGEVWCEVDVVGSDGGDSGGQATSTDDGSASTQNQVAPNDDNP